MMLNVANVLGLLVACLVVRTSVADKPKKINEEQASIYDKHMEQSKCEERHSSKDECSDCAESTNAPFYSFKINKICKTYYRGTNYYKHLESLNPLPTDEKKLKQEELKIAKKLKRRSKCAEKNKQAAGGSDDPEEKMIEFLKDLKQKQQSATELPNAGLPKKIDHFQAYMYDDYVYQKLCWMHNTPEECLKCAQNTGAPFYLIRGGYYCRTFTRGENYFRLMQSSPMTVEFKNKIKHLEGENLIKAIEQRKGKNRKCALQKKRKNEGTSQAAGGSDNIQGFQSYPASSSEPEGEDEYWTKWAKDTQ